MKNSPLVSILIPCYQAEKTIANTINSVLKQTYNHLEIIVQDDFSTDGTMQILNSNFAHYPQIKIYQNTTNKRTAANWNSLFTKANGSYWLKLDGDDLIKPDFVQITLAAALEQKSDFTATSFESLDLITKSVKPAYIHQFMETGFLNNPVSDIFIKHPFHLCFILISAKFIKAHFNKNEIFIDTEVCDAEFQINASLKPNFKAYFINQQLAYYCFHGQNSSTTPLKQAKSFVYDVVPLHAKPLKKYLGFRFNLKMKKNLTIYLKLMLKGEAPWDFKLLLHCFKYICY